MVHLAHNCDWNYYSYQYYHMCCQKMQIKITKLQSSRIQQLQKYQVKRQNMIISRYIINSLFSLFIILQDLLNQKALYFIYTSYHMQDINPQYVEIGKKALQRIKALQVSNGWKQNGVKPCKMYKMENQGRVMAKGVAVFQFLSVSDNLTKVNSMCKQVKTLNKNETYEIIYMRYAGIWPVEDRDFVTVGYRQITENKIYIATCSCKFPYPEQKKTVRAEVYVGGYIIQKVSENESQVTYFADTDLKGNIPGMLKNQLSSKQGQVPAKVDEAMKKAGF